MFFSIIFLSLFYLGLIIFKNSQRILTRNTLNNLKTLGLMIEARVTDIYERYREHLHIAAQHLSLLKALENYSVEQNVSNKESLVYVLKKFVPVENGAEEMYIFDLQGRLLAGTASFWDQQDVSGQPFFKQGLTGEFINFVKAKPVDKYADQLYLSTAIVLDNRPVAVILIVLKKDILSEITTMNLQIGESEDILLAQRNSKGDGEFIAHRRFQNNPEALPVIPKERVDIPMTQALAGKEDVFDKAVDYRGQVVLAATRYIEPLGIGLVIKIDRSEFLKPVQELSKVVKIFGGIIMFFTLFMVFIIARSLTTPIEKLSHAADKVSSGDFSVEFLTDENFEEDEIGILSRSVLTMSDKLIKANRSLESQVLMRTQELEKRLAELELVNKITTGRELQMIELKKRINQLSKQLNQEEPYDLSFINEKKQR